MHATCRRFIHHSDLSLNRDRPSVQMSRLNHRDHKSSLIFCRRDPANPVHAYVVKDEFSIAVIKTCLETSLEKGQWVFAHNIHPVNCSPFCIPTRPP
eukprot:scaffold188289_cov29-Prasinocladus_malaysianus.AAC.1